MIILLLSTACGCQEPEPTGRRVPSVKRDTGPTVVLSDRVVLTFEAVKIKRSAFHQLEQLRSYMETAGVYGLDEPLLAMNGLRVGRTDLRFREQFQKTLGAIRSDPKQVAIVQMTAGGREQNFDVGDTLTDETLFVWTDHAAVTGRHFRRARYRMALKLEQVKSSQAELSMSWQVQTGPGLNRTVSLAPLDLRAELAKGQSLVVGPVDFRGRGVGRALLSGVDEQAVEITFFVITPTEVRQKTPRAEGMDTAAVGSAARGG